jgi:hypothetical protein
MGDSTAFVYSMKPEVIAMARKIVATDSGQRRIRDVGAGARHVAPAVVAEALGAEVTGLALGRGGSPVSSFQVRSELHNRLRSSGGRPALEGATRRVKIPLAEGQWRELEELAASFTDLGFTPSAGQVASVLISLALPVAKGERDRIREELEVHASATGADK